jgi:hypothetical protein
VDGLVADGVRFSCGAAFANGIAAAVAAEMVYILVNRFWREFMPLPNEHLWKLSYKELAGLCQEMGHSSSNVLDPEHREEARRLYGGWVDALAIDVKHEAGGAERQAGMAAALRKRTIELLVRSGQMVE